MGLLISKSLTQSERVQFKAPRGYMYELHSFTWSNFSSAAIQFVVLDMLEEEVTKDLPMEHDFLIFLDCGLDGHSVSGSLDNHRCKFLSMGARATSVNVNCSIQIFGELVKASKVDLLIEWFRKGR